MDRRTFARSGFRYYARTNATVIAGVAVAVAVLTGAMITGDSVRIKQLSASPEMSKRLRELGFCEEQRVKLLSRNPNLICQVCNARLGLSSQLADLIWVEKIKSRRLAA